MSPIGLAFVATFIVSTISLVGVVFLFADWNERRAMLFISFGAGVLLATAFLELLPGSGGAAAGRRQFFHRHAGGNGDVLPARALPARLPHP